MPSLKRNPSIEQLASDLYGALPYHNFDHALFTIEAGERIVEVCAQQGRDIDWDIVYYSLLFHDAGYQDDHESKGFSSKESYSAHLADKVLKENGIPSKVAEKVSQTIMCTQRDAVCDTDEERVVKTADLAGLGSSYDRFRSDTEHLKQEQEKLTGQSISWKDWVEDVSTTVEFYLSQDICPSEGEGPYSRSTFQKNARENLERLKKEFS